MNEHNNDQPESQRVDQPPAPAESTNQPVNGPITQTSVFCIQCGYNLSGVAIGASCPECGRTVAPSFHSQTLPTSGKAIASLVLGISSIVSCMFYGVPTLVCGPLAIIFARQAKGQVERGEASDASAGMATAGLICGIVGLGLVFLMVCAVILMVMLSH